LDLAEAPEVPELQQVAVLARSFRGPFEEEGVCPGFEAVTGVEA
jgi:hypothetical protein